jgi:hypothetical protein
MIEQCGATVACANNGLIRLNKFASRIANGFCNLFFINVRTLHVTPHVTPDVTSLNFTPWI